MIATNATLELQDSFTLTVFGIVVSEEQQPLTALHGVCSVLVGRGLG